MKYIFSSLLILSIITFNLTTFTVHAFEQDRYKANPDGTFTELPDADDKYDLDEDQDSYKANPDGTFTELPDADDKYDLDEDQDSYKANPDGTITELPDADDKYDLEQDQDTYKIGKDGTVKEVETNSIFNFFNFESLLNLFG